MALQSFTLSRAAETPVTTSKLVEITPKNWRRYPAVAGSATPANIPVISYTGGAVGDDTDTATANSTTPYSGPPQLPRTQAEKATLTGNTLAVDVARPRGFIAPNQSYIAAGGSAPAAPVVSSLSPSTAPGAQLPLVVTITGTGFSPYSTVYTGGAQTPDSSGKYVDATHMTVAVWKASPGTVSIAVEDHNVWSNTNINFTVT
jgi:IPT/TIG domain